MDGWNIDVGLLIPLFSLLAELNVKVQPVY